MLRPRTTHHSILRLLPVMSLTIVTLLLSGCRPGQGPLADRDESGPLEAQTFRATWSSNIDTGRYGGLDRMFLRDDLLMVYTRRNVVYAFSAAGGRAQWVATEVVRPLETLWPPVLVENLGRLEGASERIIAFPGATSYIVYSDTGTRLAVTPIDRGQRTITSPSYGYGGMVYAGLSDAAAGRAAVIDPVRAINPVVAQVRTEGVIVSQPVVHNDVLFVADEFGRVYAISRQGFQVWQMPFFATGAPVRAPLTADDDGLYVPGGDSILYVLDRGTGRLRWRYFAERALNRPAFPTREHVFLPTETHGVVCLSKTTGGTVGRIPVWSAADAQDVLSHDDQNVYLLYRDGSIVAHAKSTGEELFRSRRTDFTRFARNRTGPTIYAGRADGQVVAIDPVLRRGDVGRMVEAPVAPGSAIPVAVVEP